MHQTRSEMPNHLLCLYFSFRRKERKYFIKKIVSPGIIKHFFRNTAVLSVQKAFAANTNIPPDANRAQVYFITDKLSTPLSCWSDSRAFLVKGPHHLHIARERKQRRKIAARWNLNKLPQFSLESLAHSYQMLCNVKWTYLFFLIAQLSILNNRLTSIRSKEFTASVSEKIAFRTISSAFVFKYFTIY